MKKKIFGMVLVFVFAGAAALWAIETKTYYPNGKVQTEVTDTMTKTYFENGQLSTETPMINGVPEGIERTYYETGKLMTKKLCREGKTIVYQLYYESGQLMFEEQRARGEWKQLDENGRLTGQGKL